LYGIEPQLVVSIGSGYIEMHKFQEEPLYKLENISNLAKKARQVHNSFQISINPNSHYTRVDPSNFLRSSVIDSTSEKGMQQLQIGMSKFIADQEMKDILRQLSKRLVAQGKSRMISVTNCVSILPSCR
jgi:hypothetical protein